MPRTCEIPPKDLEDHLKLRPDIFDEKHQLKGKKDKVWKEIKLSLNLKMEAISIYHYVYANRHQCFDNLRKHFKIPIPQGKKRKREAHHDILYDPSPSNDLSPQDCPKVQLKIFCETKNIITKINDEFVTKLGWTDIIAGHIVKQQNLPCKFNFKTKWFTESRFQFVGYCSVVECKCPIVGVCKDLEKETLTFEIKTYDCSKIKHNKFRHLRGPRRDEVGKCLVYQTAAEYSEAERSERKKRGPAPVTHSSEVALRKCRQQKLEQLINYQDFKSSSITNAKLILHCNIRLLSLNPFYVFYCSDEQIELWNKLSTRNLPLSFDDTGSVVVPYSAHGVRSKHVFYYALVLGIGNKIVTLMQALSSIHHVLIILQLFKKWLECGAKIPPELTTDGSKTLQNSACLAFNGETYDEYNVHCFRRLRDSSVQLPRCFYRQDVAHLINAFIKWSAFKSSKKEHIVFYVRCLGYIIQIESLEEFEATVKAVVIVANSTLMLDGSLCAEKKNQLIQVLQSYKEKMCEFQSTTESMEGMQGDEASVNDAKNSKRNELTQYIDDLFNSAMKYCTTDDTISEKANTLYNPQFSIMFQKLCYSFPSWTNIMKNLFQSQNERATSARSETNFGIKKKRNPTPTSVTKFLLKDKKSIDGQVTYGFEEEAKLKNIKPLEETKSLIYMLLEESNKKNTNDVIEPHNQDQVDSCSSTSLQSPIREKIPV